VGIPLKPLTSPSVMVHVSGDFRRRQMRWKKRFAQCWVMGLRSGYSRRSSRVPRGKTLWQWRKRWLQALAERHALSTNSLLPRWIQPVSDQCMRWRRLILAGSHRGYGPARCLIWARQVLLWWDRSTKSPMQSCSISKAGVTQFLFMGWPDQEEIDYFGSGVLPLVRAYELKQHARTLTGDRSAGGKRVNENGKHSRRYAHNHQQCRQRRQTVAFPLETSPARRAARRDPRGPGGFHGCRPA